MAQGLQVWDAAGALLVDTSTSIFTLVATRYANSAFSITSAVFSMGIPRYFYIPRLASADSFSPGSDGFPFVSFSGNTVNVSGTFDGYFTFGVS